MNSFDIADNFSDVGLEPPCYADDGYFNCPCCGDSYHESDPRWHLVCPSFTRNHPPKDPACEPWVCSPDCAVQWEEDNIDEIIEHYRELAERKVTHE